MAWKRSCQLHRGFLTQAVAVQSDCSYSRTSSGMFSNWSAPYSGTTRRFHSSPLLCGLEEFFPKTENLIEEGEKTGILPYSLLGGGGVQCIPKVSIFLIP